MSRRSLEKVLRKAQESGTLLVKQPVYMPMSVEERGHIVNAIIEKYIHPIMAAKGRDYTEYTQDGSPKSANQNFEEVAKMLAAAEGVDKYITWAVYFIKHIQALLSWICTREMKSEPIEGRMADAINYIFILWSMMIEDGIVEDPRPTEGRSD